MKNIEEWYKIKMKRNDQGEVVISKRSLIPLSLVITIFVAILAGAGYVMGLDSRVTKNTSEIDHVQKDIEAHIDDINVHQPFEDKLKTWYTRREGEHLEDTIKEINDKLDVLIERTTKIESKG